MIILLQHEFGNKANKKLKNKKIIEQAQKTGLNLGTEESDKLHLSRFDNRYRNIDPLENKKTYLDRISKSDKLDNNSKKAFKKDIVKYNDFYADYNSDHHKVAGGKLVDSAPDYQIDYDKMRLEKARKQSSEAAKSYAKKVKREAYNRLSPTDKVKYHVEKVTRNLENGVYKEKASDIMKKAKNAAPEVARGAKAVAEALVKDPVAYSILENIPGRINKLTGNRTKIGREDNELLNRLTKRIKRTTDIKPYSYEYGLNSYYIGTHGRLGEIHINSNNPALLAHEYGHALDQASNNGVIHQELKGKVDNNSQVSLAKEEAAASKNAMKVLEKEHATPKQKARARKQLLRAYGTYTRGGILEESASNVANGTHNREVSDAFKKGRDEILRTGRHGSERVAGRSFLDKVARDTKAKVLKRARNAKPGSILKKLLK